MATLYISRSSSECGACRHGASPNEDGHYTMLGYGVEPGTPGCGEPWTDAVYTTHMGYRYTADNVAKPGWFSNHVNNLLIQHYS